MDQASAANLRERTAWRDLLARVREGGIDLRLVTKLDRPFRSAKHTCHNLAYLDQHNVRFITTTQPIDTSASTGKLLGVLASFAEFQRALIVERMLEGLARDPAQGKRPGRPPGSRNGERRKSSSYFAR